jgi:quinol monooxygenase YgiN
MIVRIVRMKVAPENVSTFQNYFKESFSKIRNFPGCCDLSLHTDINQEGVVITFSKWESEAHLNVYRDSDVFKSTWEKVKPLFVAKPEAFSMEELN